MNKMKNIFPDLIQVLWIEDDQNVVTSYQGEAEQHGLQLVHFPCWDEAKIALETQFDRWEAIILDAKCKFHSGSHDNAIYFLGNVFPEVTGLCSSRGRVVPWYVLSGGSEHEITDSIPENRLWDAEWSKKYYEKNTERIILFDRIKEQVKRTPLMQTRLRFEKVYNAIFECKIGNNATELLDELLVDVFFPSRITEQKETQKFENVRKIIESIFRSMIEWGLVPPKERVVPEWFCYILNGKEVKINKETTIARGTEKIIPQIVYDNIIEMRHVTGSYLHSESSETTITKSKFTQKYLSSVDYSPYLLNSYAFQLCDIILWFNKYIEEHQDIEINRLNWEIIDEEAWKK